MPPPSVPESSAVDNFSSFVGPKKLLRSRGAAAGAASGMPRDNSSSVETVACPTCQAPQSVRTSKTQANPDRQVEMSLFISCMLDKQSGCAGSVTSFSVY